MKVTTTRPSSEALVILSTLKPRVAERVRATRPRVTDKVRREIQVRGQYLIVLSVYAHDDLNSTTGVTIHTKGSSPIPGINSTSTGKTEGLQTRHGYNRRMPTRGRTLLSAAVSTAKSAVTSPKHFCVVSDRCFSYPAISTTSWTTGA